MALAATMSDHNHSSTLLERDEAGRVGGAETGAAVGDGLVGDGELAEVVTDHTGLDLNSDVVLSTVDTADAANHLRDDGHVAHVRLDGGWLFKDTIDFDGGGLGLAQLLHVSDLSSRGSAVVFAAGASAEEVHGLLGAELQKTLEVLAAEAELPESALLALGVSHDEWVVGAN
mmetsp:Transcript_1267/g.1919  ORF Transcript_1267/g.1919 Transcript_1267/m.1919 type:complete len:173 (-) Transcript_1267:26-544(-)